MEINGKPRIKLCSAIWEDMKQLISLNDIPFTMSAQAIVVNGCIRITESFLPRQICRGNTCTMQEEITSNCIIQAHREYSIPMSQAITAIILFTEHSVTGKIKFNEYNITVRDIPVEIFFPYNETIENSCREKIEEQVQEI